LIGAAFENVCLTFSEVRMLIGRGGLLGPPSGLGKSTGFSRAVRVDPDECGFSH
jgi:hypothetical protein